MACRAAATLKGEHIPCDGGDDHGGWAHSNKEHELIWVGSEGPATRDVPDPYWNTVEVAAYTGLLKGMISDYRIRGTMPAPAISEGRKHLWRPADIMAWRPPGPRWRAEHPDN